MLHNGVAKRHKQKFVNLHIKENVAEELKARAYEQDLEYSEYIRKLLELEDAKAWFIDSAFARPLTNILQQVKRQAESEQEERKEGLKW